MLSWNSWTKSSTLISNSITRITLCRGLATVQIFSSAAKRQIVRRSRNKLCANCLSIFHIRKARRVRSNRDFLSLYLFLFKSKTQFICNGEKIWHFLHTTYFESKVIRCAYRSVWEFIHTVNPQKLVRLSFPTFVFLVRLSFEVLCEL